MASANDLSDKLLLQIFQQLYSLNGDDFHTLSFTATTADANGSHESLDDVYWPEIRIGILNLKACKVSRLRVIVSGTIASRG